MSHRFEDDAPDTYVSSLTEDLRKANGEIERLKREGTPGVLHAVDQAFYDLTVKERNLANTLLREARQKMAEMKTAHARELLHQYQEKEEERKILNQLHSDSKARDQQMIRGLIQDLNELLKASKDLLRTYPSLDTGVAVSNLRSVVDRILLASKSKEETV